MSLILGVHLLERIYLVSDTRLSSLDGSSYKDDLIKTFKFNDRISAVAAGRALAGSFVLNKLKKLVDENTTINELKSIVETRLKGCISDYVNTTGFHNGSIALIFGGFNLEEVKKIEASQLGKAMSAMVIAAKEKGINQSINQSIDKRLKNAFGQLGGKGKGNYIIVDGVQDAKLFSLTFDVQTASISELKIAECYQYIIFHPDKQLKTIQLPGRIISLLEFRNRENKSAEEILYEDSEILINFVRGIIRENNFSSVGGHVFPLVQTPVMPIFVTGDIGTFRQGQIVKVGSFYVENNAQMYELEDGTKGEYRHLEELSKIYLKNVKPEEMLI